MRFIILISVLALASSNPVFQDESVMRLMLSNVVNCVNSDLSLCLKENALKATERLRTVRQINIIEGVTILNNGPKEAKSLELSSEPEARSKQVTDRLWESTSQLLENSDLELSFPSPVEEDESRAIDEAEEGRGKKKEIKKKLRILVPLLILAKAKAVAIALFALVVIAISVFKLAALAKILFIAKLIAIVKHLLHKKHAEEEHGWIPVPHHHEEHAAHGWDGGWSRSRNEANNLAYSAYTN